MKMICDALLYGYCNCEKNVNCPHKNPHDYNSQCKSSKCSRSNNGYVVCVPYKVYDKDIERLFNDMLNEFDVTVVKKKSVWKTDDRFWEINDIWTT